MELSWCMSVTFPEISWVISNISSIKLYISQIRKFFFKLNGLDYDITFFVWKKRTPMSKKLSNILNSICCMKGFHFLNPNLFSLFLSIYSLSKETFLQCLYYSLLLECTRTFLWNVDLNSMCKLKVCTVPINFQILFFQTITKKPDPQKMVNHTDKGSIRNALLCPSL